MSRVVHTTNRVQVASQGFPCQGLAIHILLPDHFGATATDRYERCCIMQNFDIREPYRHPRYRSRASLSLDKACECTDARYSLLLPGRTASGITWPWSKETRDVVSSMLPPCQHESQKPDSRGASGWGPDRKTGASLMAYGANARIYTHRSSQE